jgi:serine/threonine protein kinase/WD40 repeat protein
MKDLSETRDPLDELGDEFLGLVRRGERPHIDDFAARDPARAQEIRDFLSALLFVEGLKPQADITIDAIEPGSSRPVHDLERLGDFRIVRELGRGGMGIVYEAEQESLSRRVALKVLAPGMARTSQQTRRFLREARAAARLHHTNIVPVFGVGEENGLYYYAMQFIPGLGLDKVLGDIRRLKCDAHSESNDSASPTRHWECDESATPPVAPNSTNTDTKIAPRAWMPAALLGPSVLRSTTDSEAQYAHAVAGIGLQVAEALEYAHRHGTLHRDVKPSNILLDPQRIAWVTDFGLAKAVEDEDLTRTGDVVGTLRYMAPERFRGVCDASSDVYGLGLALYELLALRAAFDAPEREGLLYQVNHVEPPRLRSINPALPRDLETIIHKAIEKEPNHRYKTAAELAEDLRCFLEDRPIRARRVGSTERLTRWARRNPGSATLGTALGGMLALVVIVIVVADLRLRRQNVKTEYHLQRAERAENDATTRLLASSINHARASRRSRFAGRRFEGLRAIDEATQLDNAGDSRLELRNEAIACLALPDLRPLDSWPIRPDDGFLGVDFDPMTGRMARGTVDGSVIVRGARGTGERLLLPGNGRRAVFVRFSRDGRHLAVKSEEDGHVHVAVWDLGRVIKVLDLSEGMYSDALDFHPNGNIVATGRRDGSIVFHDLTSGRTSRRLNPGTIPRTLRFDPSGQRIVVVSSNSREGVQVRQVIDGAVVASWQVTKPAYSVDWHPSGRWLAVGAEDGTIQIQDMETPARTPRTYEVHDGQVVSLAFHPEGSLLASASWDGSLRLLEFFTGRELVRAPLPEARPIRFSRDGRLLGPGHDEDASWLWEVATGEECRPLGGSEIAGATTPAARFLEPDGLLASFGSSGVRLDLLDKEYNPSFLDLPGTSDVAVSPDGSFLMTSGTAGVLRWPVHRAPSSDLRIGPPEPVKPLAGFPTGRLRIGQDSRTVAVVVDDERGWVRVLDLDKQATLTTFGDHLNAELIDLSPDGRWLATGTWQGTQVKVWDMGQGRLVKELPVEGSAEVVFNPDGGRLLTASGKEYALWETGTWRQLLQIQRTQSGGLPGVAAFSPDGRVLAIAQTRSTVQLIDAATGQPHATLETPEPRNVSGLRFNRDGRILAVAHNGSRVQAWDLLALRRGLVKLGLDWSAPYSTELVTDRTERPTSVVVQNPPWLEPLARGEALARAQRWNDAAAEFQRAITAGAPHIDARLRRVLFLRARGDSSAYRDACRDLLSSFDLHILSPRVANNVAWACALEAGCVEDYEPLIRLARSVAAVRPEPNRLNTLGAILFRAGQFEEAIRQLEQSVAAHGAGGTAYDAIFLAMAHHRLGNREQALRWLQMSHSQPVATFKPDADGDTSWIPHLELEVLRREAAKMIGSAIAGPT